MKEAKILIGTISILSMILILVFVAGCQPKPSANVTISPEPDVNINPITGGPYADIVDKRGVQTNITEFNELVKRASAIESFRYELTDTGLGIEDRSFLVLTRFVKVKLPELMQHRTGEWYDEVLMERTTKTAFSHCSIDNCPRPDLDKEIERVDYEEYYINDPMEYLYEATNAEFVKEELLGNDYTKVFSIKFEDNEARIWLQEYYGYPMKIIVRNDDGSKRTIKFDEMMVNNVRKAEVDLPFNSTIKGEDKHWWFWEHYLGEWEPPRRLNIPGVPEEPVLGV
jgi:hypothetical protein